jgi:hypothetical protein
LTNRPNMRPSIIGWRPTTDLISVPIKDELF